MQGPLDIFGQTIHMYYNMLVTLELDSVITAFTNQIPVS